jgi:hypothetical protein
MEKIPEFPVPLTREDFTIVEYQSLRAEMMSNSQIVSQVFTVTVTGVAALVGFGIQSGNAYLFLVPPLFLLPSLLFISSQLEALIRIAAFIPVFIEPEMSGLHWEMALNKLRSRHDRAQSSYIFSLIGIYFILILICLILPWLFVRNFTPPQTVFDIVDNVPLQIASVSALILFATVLIGWRTAGGYSNARLKHYQKEWTRVREQMEAEAASKPQVPRPRAIAELR